MNVSVILILSVCTIFAADPNDQSIPVENRLFSAVHGYNKPDLGPVHFQIAQILRTKVEEGGFLLTLDAISRLANDRSFLRIIENSPYQIPWMMDPNSYTHSNIPEHLRSQHAEPLLGLIKIFEVAIDIKKEKAALKECMQLAHFEQKLLANHRITKALALFRFMEKSGIEPVFIPTRYLYCSFSSRFTHAQSKRFVFNIPLNFDRDGDTDPTINFFTDFYHSLSILQGVVALEVFGNSYLRDKHVSSQSISAGMCQVATIHSCRAYNLKDSYIAASPHLIAATQAFDLIYNGAFSPILCERILGFQSQDLDELIYVTNTPQTTLEKIKLDFQEQFELIRQRAQPDLAQSNTDTFLETCTAWLPSSMLDTLGTFVKNGSISDPSFLCDVYTMIILERFLNGLLTMRPHDRELTRLSKTLPAKCLQKCIDSNVSVSLQATNCSMPCLLYLTFENKFGEITPRLLFPRPDILSDARNFDLLKASLLYFEKQLTNPNYTQKYIFDDLCDTFLQLCQPEAHESVAHNFET